MGIHVFQAVVRGCLHRPGARAGSGARSGFPPPRRRRGPRRWRRGPGPPGAARAGSPARQPPAARAQPQPRRSSRSPCACPRTAALGAHPRRGPRLAVHPTGRRCRAKEVDTGAEPGSRAERRRCHRRHPHAEGHRGRCAGPGGGPTSYFFIP